MRALYVLLATWSATGQIAEFFLPHIDNEANPPALTNLLSRANALMTHPDVLVVTTEERPVDFLLPENCSRIFWKIPHGKFAVYDIGAPIHSGVYVPAKDFCAVTFTPDHSYFGEQTFWFATSLHGQLQPESNIPAKQFALTEKLHAGVISVVPMRDAAVAVDDYITVEAGGWAIIPVLQNDEDDDTQHMDNFHACVRKTAKPPLIQTNQEMSGHWLDIVAIADSADHAVTVHVAGMEPQQCKFNNNLPLSQFPRCTTHLQLPSNSIHDNVLRHLEVQQVSELAGRRAERYLLEHVAVNTTLFIRLRKSASFFGIGSISGGVTPRDIQYSYAGHIMFANQTVPECDVFKIAGISDPLHGHAIAITAPRTIESDDNKRFLPGLPCFLVGGPLFESHRNYLALHPATFDVIYPKLSDVDMATLKIACNGNWQNGAESPTSVYTLPNEAFNTVILYYPDPGFVGNDSLTYDVNDGHAGQGIKGTGKIHITVAQTAAQQGCIGWKCNIQTFDGTFNNLNNSQAGAMMTPLSRIAPPAYADGIDSPAGSSRQSTRLISNVLFQQSEPIPSANGISELHVHFGQFLTHDLDFATPLADFKSEGNFVIPIPKGDPWFDVEATGEATMRFRRSGPQFGTGEGTSLPRQQLNKVTAWLDLNVIYGTLVGRNRVLRTMTGGKLLHLIGHNATSGYNTHNWVHAAKNVEDKKQEQSCHQSSAAELMASHEVDEPVVGPKDRVSSNVLTEPVDGVYCVELHLDGSAVQRCKPQRAELEHLALNTAHLPNLNLLGRPRDSLFVSGDNRVNVQPGLSAMHTLLAREHNIIADELMAALLIHNPNVNFSTKAVERARYPHAPSFHKPLFPPLPVSPPRLLSMPGLTLAKSDVPYPVPILYPYAYDGTEEASRFYDEVLFQSSRAILRAKWQGLVWYEWLPTVIGPAAHARLPPYNGYNASLDPSVSNEFATAAFRFGHSQVASTMRRYEPTGCPSLSGPISLRDAYFTAMRLLGEGGVDPIIAGSLLFPAEEVDTKAVNEIRNLLFATNTQGFDLIALNIQRGRDHGLPDYNTVRKHLGLPPKRTFSEVTSNQHVASLLSELYGPDGIDDMDLTVAGLAEDHSNDSAVGETFAALIADTFVRVRDADRFWFENTASPQYSFLTSIAPLEAYRNTRIADLIARNTDVLDGRFGAEIVAWQRDDGAQNSAAAASWSRVQRESIPPNLSESLFYARPVAIDVLSWACAGISEPDIAAQLVGRKTSADFAQVMEEAAIEAAYGF